MINERRRKRLSIIFLILGIAFLAIGLTTDQTAFTWIAVAYIVISLLAGRIWLRPRK